jgi:tRNA A-37 threonylcarbamoyl transferase component Bud32
MALSRPWAQFKVGGAVWLAREALPIMDDPEAFLQDPSLQIKSSRVVTIARVPPNLILRRLNYGKLLHRLRDCLRPSRAVRALIASTWLEQAGIRTPRALAAGEVRLLRWPITGYLVTEEVPNARTLATLFTSRHRIPRGLPDLIARLHNSGLSHRDLKWTNILFDDDLLPWLIDLDGVRRLGQVPDARAQEDLWTLARCFASHPVTLKWSGGRFLYHYCALRKLPFKAWGVALLRRLQSGA